MITFTLPIPRLPSPPAGPAGRRRRGAAALLLLAVPTLLGLAAAPVAADGGPEEKVRAARWIYEELLRNPERQIPHRLMVETRCLAIFPDLVEAAFGIGGSHGTGVVSCRNEEGIWSPPAFLKLTEGSIGLQLGYQVSDLVMFFVTDDGVRSLSKPRFSLGGEASVAAGPVQKTAEVTSDVELNDDIYLYAQVKGLFAGASFEGSRLSFSTKAITQYYGHYIWHESIIFDHRVPDLPASAVLFMEGLAEIPGPDDPPLEILVEEVVVEEAGAEEVLVEEVVLEESLDAEDLPMDDPAAADPPLEDPPVEDPELNESVTEYPTS